MKALPLVNLKRGKRFLVAGAINTIITAAALQALLLSNSINILTCTLLAQLINMMLGYFLYGKFVFRSSCVNYTKSIAAYGAVMAVLWAINTLGISAGASIGIGKNFAALTMIPVLALFSYHLQRKFVFAPAPTSRTRKSDL